MVTNFDKLLEIQMDLEGIGIDEAGFIFKQDYFDEEYFPKIIVAKSIDGQYRLFIENNISTELVSKLKSWSGKQVFHNVKKLVNMFNENGITLKPEHYRVYTYPQTDLVFDDVSCIEEKDKKIFAIKKEDKIVSYCISSRKNKYAHEAWVVTEPEFRMRGLGHKVALSWGQDILKNKLIPFYSHEVNNIPSEKLASKLGLKPTFEEITF